jgi:hypothetical protein
MRRSLWALLAACVCLVGLGLLVWRWSLWKARQATPALEVLHVHPGDDIQEVLDAAAQCQVKPTVRIHAGVYRPRVPSEALIHFNARHDGITLEGDGEVILAAANPEVADARAESYPAVVNHVVYFGDGISEMTLLRNVKITGANGFVRGPADLPSINTYDDIPRSARYSSHESTIEAQELPKTPYFYRDGGAILIYGKSFPTI